MKKSIFNAIGLAVIAALLCASCGDNGLDRSSSNNGDVDGFLDRIHGTPDTAGNGGNPVVVPPDDGGGTPTTPVTYTLIVSANPPDGGYVSLDPDQLDYNKGARVTATATANTGYGYRFKGWSGASTSTSAEVTITMDGNKTLTANFEAVTVDPCASGATAACCAAQSSYPGCPTPAVNVYCRYGSAAACYTIPDDQTNRNGCTADNGFVVTSCSAAPSTAECNVYSSMTGCSASTPAKYTVTFNSNGGTGTAPAAQTVNAGSYITLPSGSGLTKSGSTFGGWSDGTGYNYDAGSTYYPAGTVTLYAVWNTSSGTVDNSLVSGTNQAWIAYSVDSYNIAENFGYVFKSNGQVERIEKNNTSWTCIGTGKWNVEGSGTDKYVNIVMADNSYGYYYSQFSTGLGKRLSITAIGGGLAFIKETGTWPSCSNNGNPTDPCAAGTNIIKDPNFLSVKEVTYTPNAAVSSWYNQNAWTKHGWREDTTKVEPVATFTVSSGKMTINVSRVSSGLVYEVQLIQYPISLTKGVTYKLSFEAYASVPGKKLRAAVLETGEEGGVWALYGGVYNGLYSGDEDYDIALTTTNQKYESQFKMEYNTDTKAQLQINSGASVGSVTISNISLVPCQ